MRGQGGLLEPEICNPGKTLTADLVPWQFSITLAGLIASHGWSDDGIYVWQAITGLASFRRAEHNVLLAAMPEGLANFW